MEISESQIIGRIQSGELNQFAALYDIYIKKIYDFIYYKTFHKETAEDLTSLTFTKALENINKYDSGKGSFSSWLYRIARNTVIDHYRTKKTESNIEDIWDLSGNDDIQRDTDVQQTLKEIQKYLEKLKPQQREIVIMRLWDQLSYQEIAEITGQSLANCKMIFSRTIRKVREDMALILLYLILTINSLM